MFIMLFVWILVLALGFAVVSLLFPRQNHPTFRSEEKTSALEILAQRYARGELSREQYELMRHDLSSPYTE